MLAKLWITEPTEDDPWWRHIKPDGTLGTIRKNATNLVVRVRLVRCWLRSIVFALTCSELVKAGRINKDFMERLE